MIKLKTQEDTNDPTKINRSIESVFDKAKRDIEASKGIVPLKEEPISAGTTLPDIKESQLFTEFNDGSKRLMIKIKGEVYEIGSLTKVT